MLMGHICRRFDEGGTPYTINELRDKTGVPIRVVNDLMYKLVEAKLAVEITSDEKGEQSRFLPAQSTDQLSLGIMIDRIESLGKWKLDWDRSSLNESVWTKAIAVRSNYLKQSKRCCSRISAFSILSTLSLSSECPIQLSSECPIQLTSGFPVHIKQLLRYGNKCIFL